MIEPLGDGVQDGVVVLVHLAQLLLAEAVRLPADAPRHEGRPEPRQQGGHETGEEQPGQLGAHPLADGRLADADGDERDDLPGVGDGHDDAGRGSERAGVVLLDDATRRAPPRCAR